jgi:hypothetical protein
MHWQLVGTLVCCLLLRFLEFSDDEGKASSVLGKGALDVTLVCTQFGAALFYLGKLIRWGANACIGENKIEPDDSWRKRVGKTVRQVRAGGADAEEVLLLRETVKERDQQLRLRDTAVKEQQDLVKERDDRIRLLEGGYKDLQPSGAGRADSRGGAKDV